MAQKPKSKRKRTTKKSTISKGKGKGTRKISSRRKTPASKTNRNQSSRQSKQVLEGPWGDRIALSLDRKLDISGVIMAIMGSLILLAIINAGKNQFFDSTISYLRRGVGWGLYVLPLGLIILGLWLILRDFERLPQMSIERVFGLTSLYINLLTFIHFFHFPNLNGEIYALAEAGSAGGYSGAIILKGLLVGFGIAGTGISLTGWLILNLAIIFDKPVISLFGWIQPIFTNLQDWLVETMARRTKKRPAYTPAPGSHPIMAEGGSMTASSVARTHHPRIAEVEDGLPKSWVLPVIADIFDSGDALQVDDEIDRHRANIIEETLESFNAPGKVVEINRGPTITQFGVEPDFIVTRGRKTRVRVGKISGLSDDLALAMAATQIRIQAPVPGKGYIGIEVPNEKAAVVTLRDGIESNAFKKLKDRPLRFTLGQDAAGNAVSADLASMPHLLIAGTTGSGKSVSVNGIISSLLAHNTPDTLRMIMVDPKRVELTGYNGIPHLLSPVVVQLERVVAALHWVLREMDQRYKKFSKVGARNIIEYNKSLAKKNETEIPYLVVIIDELADLMMLAPDETERAITRLAQLARATGIHMVISTQRPSVDVVTGLIKANFPARIAFATSSGVDSRVIIDQPGAERLLGRGDMLFLAPDAPAPVRLQGVFVSDIELLRLVQFWRAQTGYKAPEAAPVVSGGIPDMVIGGIPLKQMPLWDEIKRDQDADPMESEAVDLIRRRGRASISMLQRRLRIGYTRAARIIETLEEKGIISTPKPGAQHREVLDYGETAPPVDED